MDGPIPPRDAPGAIPARGTDSAPAQKPLRRWLDRLVAVGFVVALATPAFLLALGYRPLDLENRAPAAFPRVSLRSLTDPEFYVGIDRFLNDNLPLRPEAVQVHAGIDRGILGGTTNPDVIEGRDGWLFHVVELHPRCDFDAAHVLDQIDAAAGGLRAAGIEFRYLVAPDKHAIYPDKLPSPIPTGPPCSDAWRDALRAGLAARPDTTVETWTPVLAARAATPTAPLYYSGDSHWTPLGAMPTVQALVESLAPGTWDDREIVVDGTETRATELTRLIGLPAVERVPRLVVRPGVVVHEQLIETGVHLESARDIPWFTVVAGGRRVVPGRTLVVYDSFYGDLMERISPWFAESVWVHEGDLLNHPELADALPPFDTVVFERAERGVYFTDVASDLRTVIAVAERR